MVTHTQEHLDDQVAAILGKVVVEALSGNLTSETVAELRHMPKDIEAIPQPFRDLIKQAAGSASTGRDLTLIVLDEIHGVCEELFETL
jgi:hypothetical protein